MYWYVKQGQLGFELAVRHQCDAASASLSVALFIDMLRWPSLR